MEISASDMRLRADEPGLLWDSKGRYYNVFRRRKNFTNKQQLKHRSARQWASG
jgi:hypothetical protein